MQESRFTVIITRDALMSQDPGCFLDLGLKNSADYDVIVAKSGYHYKLSFSEMSDCVNAATPGLTMYEPEKLGLLKARPIHPIDNFRVRTECGDYRLGAQGRKRNRRKTGVFAATPMVETVNVVT